MNWSESDLKSNNAENSGLERETWRREKTRIVTYSLLIDITFFFMFSLLMMLFQSELDWSVLELLGWPAGSGRWTPLQKQETTKDRQGLARCRSDA